MNIFETFTVACVISLTVLASYAVTADMPIKTVLLVGPSDAGKEIVANTLVNRGNGGKDHSQIFMSRNSTIKKYCSAYIDERLLVLIDTFGMGDPLVDQPFAFSVFERTMSHINYDIDLVIFVIKSGAMSDEEANYFRIFYERVVLGGCSSPPNILLVCNDCQSDWLEAVMLNGGEERRLLTSMFNNSSNMRLFELRADSSRDLANMVDNLLVANTRVKMECVRDPIFKSDFLQATHDFTRFMLKRPHETASCSKRKSVILAGYTGGLNSTL